MPKSDTSLYIVKVCNSPGAQWDGDTMGRGHSGTGTQWDGDTMGRTQWDGDTMGRGHNDMYPWPIFLSATISLLSALLSATVSQFIASCLSDTSNPLSTASLPTNNYFSIYDHLDVAVPVG